MLNNLFQNSKPSAGSDEIINPSKFPADMPNKFHTIKIIN